MSSTPVSVPEPSARLPRLAALHTALRQADPDAQVALDPDSGKMKVLTVLPPEEVMRLLQELGETAELLDEEGEASTGGGSCGCGCSRR